jgi:rhamnogalacturonan endolyase
MAVTTQIHNRRRPARRSISALAALLLGMSGIAAAALPPAPGKQVEKLDRGVVAIHTSAGNFISWRALGPDPAGLAFNLYRDGKKLNPAPLALTNFSDPGAPAGASYSVRPVLDGAEQDAVAANPAWDQPYKRVPLQKPADGVTPDGQRYGYVVNDGSAADLDGDGSYELLVKWQPTNAHDNSQQGYTGDTYIDAYKLDGTRLWRIDLGRNIRAGAHYTTYLAYDFDGDGKAEVMMKTADGTVDGQGKVIGDASADYRNKAGYVLDGPEFITVFNGRSGAAMASAGYLPARGDVAAWGDSYGNRVDRFLGGVAYLDGSRPSAVFSRGYYTRAVLAAWDWRDGKLTSRWVFDSDAGGPDGPNNAANHQGAHWMSVADVNGDGKDELIYGAATIASDGKLLYSTGLCHGDALHVGKLDPKRPGLQAYMVHETPSCYRGMGAEMHDAATGKILWSVDGRGGDIGRGTCMDIDPAYPGEECWATVGGLMSAAGQEISRTHPRSVNFGLWWDGDLLRESLDGSHVDKWNPRTGRLERLLEGASYGAGSTNGTKSTPVLSADLFGDWREEVVWRSADDDALLVFSTTTPTPHRLTTLMQDPQYRVQVAAQNAGYNQPPHPSFFLGDGMQPPARQPIYVP